MSAREAAGWALSRFQRVSVVPMIQCLPHGMTNSTDFSVRMMSPLSEWMRSRGTTRWMPLDARTWICPRPPTSCWMSSVHTPVALTTWRARTSNSAPFSRSHTRTPVTRSPSRRKPIACTREATCAPYVAAVRSVVITKRASSTWASQYCTAPVKADLRSEGTTRSAWRRVRWRCPGTPRVRPGDSPSVS